ncbi:hypothetical protein MTO96_034056 [Rhipicephalus appendiculatus]
MGIRRMRLNGLLVSQCLIYLVPTFAAALSMCNNPAPAESGKKISVQVSISRPESRSASTICRIPFLHGKFTMKPVGCCLFCREMNRTLQDKTPCYAIPPHEALEMKLRAPRSCPLGLCENGVCTPTGKYELCESMASYDKN